METMMQLKQLKRLAQELEQCEKQLSSKIRRLDALCESRYGRQIEKKLSAESLYLKKQAGLCKDLAAVLEQAVYMYERTEEQIIQAGETDSRRYEETLQAVSLTDLVHIPVTLKL